MRFFADENIDKPIVDRLRDDGHEVLFIAELEPGIDDRTVLARSLASDSILLTADKDFGDLVFRQNLLYAGVLRIRLSGLPPDVKAEIASTTVSQHSEDLKMEFGVLSERALRLRRQPH